MACSLDFSLSPEIGESSKVRSMHSDFGPAVYLQKISKPIKDARNFARSFHLHVAMNIADRPGKAGGDLAKCQQAVHGLIITSLAVSGKRPKWSEYWRGLAAMSSTEFPECRAKKSPLNRGLRIRHVQEQRITSSEKE